MCSCNSNTTGYTSDCNDYSLLTSNTGIAQVTTGNSNLDGTGATIVLTAGLNGTIVKSVIIKATGPVTTGMVRLFIQNAAGSLTSLYKEIPISACPTLEATPTPAPVLQTFEMILDGGLKLQNGYKLLATTQTTQTFNIIAEGLNYAYPVDLPDSCCNFKQETSLVGLGTVSAANTNLDGSGNKVTIFTAPSAPNNGSVIRSITIKALQSTTENGMIRLFISTNGSNYYLIKEIPIPKSNQSAFEPSFKVVLEENLHIQPGCIIAASTQLAQSFSLTVEGAVWTYPIA